MNYGTLYGVGVGPGAPDLITLRALTVLKHALVSRESVEPVRLLLLALRLRCFSGGSRLTPGTRDR